MGNFREFKGKLWEKLTESGMSRRVKEGNFFAILELNCEGANVLSNSTRFSFSYGGVSQRIQQRCFAVIDVAHYLEIRELTLKLGKCWKTHSDDGCSRFQ